MSDDAQPRHPSVDDLTARMTRAMQAAEYQEALPLLDTLITHDPTHADIIFSRGLAYYQLRHYDRALLDFIRAQQQGADSADLYFMRGRTYALLHDAPAALHDLQAALDRQPSSAVYATRARLYSVLGQSVPAIHDMDAALTLEPSNGTFYYQRGLLRMQTNDPNGALADFEQALVHHYQHPDVYLQRGHLLRSQDTAAAYQSYSDAIALDRRLVAAYQARADLALANDQTDAAVTDLTTVLKLQPDHAEARVQRGQALLLRHTGDDALQARRDFSEVLRAVPDHRLALCGRALAYLRLGKPQRAEPDLYAFVSDENTTDDEEQAGVAWLILALAQQAKWEEAHQQIALMHERYPQLADSTLMAAQEGWDEAARAQYAQAWHTD